MPFGWAHANQTPSGGSWRGGFREKNFSGRKFSNYSSVSSLAIRRCLRVVACRVAAGSATFSEHECCVAVVVHRIQRVRVLCCSGCPPHPARLRVALQRLFAASLRVCVLRRIAGSLPLANNRRLFPDRSTRLLPGVGPTALPGRFPATGSLKRGHPSLVAMKKRS